ncbi:MAG: hypothetical protein ACK551_07275 [Vampirovibrionales bacterium]
MENFKKLGYIFLNYLYWGLFFSIVYFIMFPAVSASAFLIGVSFAFLASPCFGNPKNPNFIENTIYHILILSGMLAFFAALVVYLLYSDIKSSLISLFSAGLFFIFFQVVLIVIVQLLKALWTKFKPNREKEETDAS